MIEKGAPEKKIVRSLGDGIIIPVPAPKP